MLRRMADADRELECPDCRSAEIERLRDIAFRKVHLSAVGRPVGRRRMPEIRLHHLT